MDQEVIILLNVMIKRYGFDAFIADFCDGIEVIENNEFYECFVYLIETEYQREKIRQCRDQFDNIDATIIMPQNINRKAYILLKKELSLESSIRKAIHEFVHLVHRCIITKKMNLTNLYEIEENQEYKLFYYLDEFLTKKKELVIYYDLLHKNRKIVDDNIYIVTMAENFKFAQESSPGILEFMRNELFAIAETMAYISIFPDIFPNNFIEDQANIKDIGEIINILAKFDSIDAYVKNKIELEEVITMLERSYFTSHQK
ncbi:hypothetical protein V1226_09630 [Lachnospiraceae bacterium JLR.KK009]|nr:hypothetical protein C810_01740 [Lachnospiraceae bacterium A2]